MNNYFIVMNCVLLAIAYMLMMSIPPFCVEKLKVNRIDTTIP